MLTLTFFLFGLIIGSFLNVVILRHGARSIDGRSGCMSCGHTLAWYDLVPVVSWVLLFGKCRYCGAKISAQYPAVELATAVLFALVGAAPISLVAQLVALPVIALLMCMTVYDLHHTIIPDEWSYGFAALAFAVSLVTMQSHGANELVLLAMAGPIAAAPIFFLWVVSRGRWIGLGDAKLSLGIGWLLGFPLSLIAIYFAFVLGAVVAVCILLPLPHLVRYGQKLGITLLKKWGKHYTMKSEVPFGPFLIASCLLLWFISMYNIPLIWLV